MGTFGKKKFTKMVMIFVTKFGDSQNPSPNLVKKIALFKSIFVLKKNHQNGRDVRHQIWWKKSHIFKFIFVFIKKITKMVTITVTKFGESQNPSPNLVKKIALFYSQYTLVFLPHTIIFWLLGHSCCPLWSPTPALCLPNKGNHRDTRLVHKGELHYKHTICQGT